MNTKVYFTLGEGGRAPTKAHPGDAGWDLYTSRPLRLGGGVGVVDVHTDICIALQNGWFGQIVPRSSTLHRLGIQVIPGVIDSGYRGELFIQVLDTVGYVQVVEMEAGIRIAQLLILPVPDIEWVHVQFLPESQRGKSGFGGSGR